MSDAPAPRPADRPEEHERQAMVHRIQEAMAQGHLDFEELDDRFASVYGAETRAELAATVADLPMPPVPGPPPAAQPLPPSSFALFGDVKVGGWADVDGNLSYATLFGDVVVDLSSAQLPADITVTTFSLFGDTVVIVPDGARASIQSFVIFGDRRTALSPPRPEAPTIRVKSTQVFGDAKLYSLSQVPEGRFRQLWRKLRERG